jgi:uncharacterized protein YndB with AHSA1/START domain
MTTKKFGALTLKTPSDLEISLSRVFDAPRTRVFDALTNPELIREWLLGPAGWNMIVCTVDLKVDGGFRYVWCRDGSTEDIGMRGTYREIKAPTRIVHTERFDKTWYPGEATVTTKLSERSGKTTFTGILKYESKEARDIVLNSAMDQGVTASYDQLAELLAKG